eukprot:359773-Chlamydomonas_euryale.AAC.5
MRAPGAASAEPPPRPPLGAPAVHPTLRVRLPALPGPSARLPATGAAHLCHARVVLHWLAAFQACSRHRLPTQPPMHDALPRNASRIHADE